MNGTVGENVTENIWRVV